MSKSCILDEIVMERRFIMKKIIKTGIAVGTVMIFVQIGNLIYAEENPIQNTEYVVESENVSENTENVTESYTEDVAGTDEYAIKKQAGIWKGTYGIIIIQMGHRKQAG